MGDGSGGANTADSYIGSLISLTSKSEIRYEGILFTVDTENSNIALQNVRSFGTEGRKKDGLPIYASDKVYDYIIFRGSDIKDLQVKSSPSIQPPPQPPTDPAIISLQSQYSQPASIPPAYVQPPPGPQDAPPQLPYPGLPPAAFRGGVPQMYQPAPAWGPPPPTGPNGNLAMPMYWQGYYRPPGGQPMLQQQMPPQPPPSLPQPPLGQPQPQALQQQLGSRPAPPLNLSSGVASPLVSQLPTASTGPLPSNLSVPAPVSDTVAAVLTPQGSSSSLQVPVVSTPAPNSASPAVASSLPISAAPASAPVMQGISAVITPAAKNPRRVVGSAQPSPPQPQGVTSLGMIGSSSISLTTSAAVSSTTANVAQRSLPATQAPPPGVLSVPGKTFAGVTSSTVKQDLKGAEPSKPQAAISSTPGHAPQQQTQPLLPLPTASTPQKQTHQAFPGSRPALLIFPEGNGNMGHTYVRRGRGRGSGSGRGIGLAQPTQQFTEDFDFMAMNEKFNKNEVWGVLGGKGDSREKIVDEDEEEIADGIVEEEVLDKDSPDSKKTLYVKDDFFDSLSCDALDREEGRAERTKFSEQRKIDTETFGNFPLRSRGGRRGGRRGGYRGGYYGGGYMGGRGNNYGRGRGAPRSTTAIN